MQLLSLCYNYAYTDFQLGIFCSHCLCVENEINELNWTELTLENIRNKHTLQIQFKELEFRILKCNDNFMSFSESIDLFSIELNAFIQKIDVKIGCTVD